MVKEVTNPYRSPSRAVVPARERAKRRQGRMWAGLMSNEIHLIRSAEAVIRVEGNTARTDSVRSGRAPRCQRTQARMYVQTRDLGSLPVTTARCAVVAEAKAGADRRMNGGEESDSAIVVMKPANKAWSATWRSWRSEGPGATGDAKERPGSEHRVGKPLGGLDAGPERSGTAVPEGCRHNRSEEPDALARTSGSGRGPSGNRRATATSRRWGWRSRRGPRRAWYCIPTAVASTRRWCSPGSAPQRASSARWARRATVSTTRWPKAFSPQSNASCCSALSSRPARRRNSRSSVSWKVSTTGNAAIQGSAISRRWNSSRPGTPSRRRPDPEPAKGAATIAPGCCTCRVSRSRLGGQRAGKGNGKTVGSYHCQRPCLARFGTTRATRGRSGRLLRDCGGESEERG